ncbi:MAG TPA: SxtJ family membrane protein [Longimicrobiales bacterium]|nr:SxtJ family membrane protein [Longimicrobiales bacterium]
MEARVPARLSAADGRRFGLTVGSAFLALALLLWWRGHETARAVTGAAGTLFILGGLLLPGHMGPVYRAWLRFGLAISKVTTPIFMAIIFFLVITPFGLAARAFGHRPLRPRRSDSFWQARAEGERKSDLHRQF